MPHDSDGLAVYDCLLTMHLPDPVEVVEGGLAGLNLLPFLENADRIVFVDTVSGFGEPGSLVILDHETLLNTPHDDYYSHETGLVYMLKVLPKVAEGNLPEEIVLVGLEGPCERRMHEEAAVLSLSIALHGSRDDS